MPQRQHIAVLMLKGLPTDDEILEFRNRLILCKQALRSEIEYESATSGGLFPTDDDFELYDQDFTRYDAAIAALNALLPDEIKQATA